MQLAIVGATGFLGRILIGKGLDRGHSVRAVAPDAQVADLDPRVERFAGTSDDAAVLGEAFAGADCVVIAFPASLTTPETYPDQVRAVIDATRLAGVPRLVGVVGSAGAFVSSGQYVVDTDYFQETTRHFYQSVHLAWSAYEEERELAWTAVVPAARMQRHLEQRGHYRTRTDRHIVTTDETSLRYFDVSVISYPDFATAVLDVVEHGERHIHQFVTTGY